jgi:nicotinamide phosphoribosyltransferase
MKRKPLHLIDWYKISHYKMYPEDTTRIVSNNTPRKCRIPGIDYTVFFSLQYFIKEYLIKVWNEEFFNKPKSEVIADLRRRVETSLGPDAITYQHVEWLHDLGYLPLEIYALPEGVCVPIKVPPFIIYNTKPEAYWLVNYLETVMSASLWQACTSATIAREYKKMFDEFAMETVGSTDFTPWQGHDFAFRGMSSVETACLSGAAHLLSFTGTDTVPAIDFLEEYYNADCTKEMIGGSVPATEHSVVCMNGMDEISTLKRLFKLYPSGVLSYVSDTWDYWDVITNKAKLLKDDILARDGKLVFRPDSSKKTPFEIICGDEEAEPGSPEYKGSIEVLWDEFGGTISEKGYKLLDSHVGLIYGDSITLDLARRVNQRLKEKGFASINWVAGIGSFTYQYNTRDTFGWAVKATYGEVLETVDYIDDGHHGHYGAEVKEPVGREIFKDPKTDSGMKKSAKGLIAVYKGEDGKYFLKDQATWAEVRNCSFWRVYSDGKLLVDQTLSEIRERIK